MSTATIDAPPVREKGHTITETAEILQVHPQTVYRFIWAERLGYERRGGRYLIFERHISAYRAANSSAADSGGGSQEPSGSGPSGPAGTRPK